MIKDVHMEGPIAQAEGYGSAGLLNQKLAFRLALKIRAQYAGKLGPLQPILAKITDAQGFVQLPLSVGGTFKTPEYRVDQRWLAEKIEEAEKETLKKQE